MRHIAGKMGERGNNGKERANEREKGEEKEKEKEEGKTKRKYHCFSRQEDVNLRFAVKPDVHTFHACTLQRRSLAS